ncbi:hypothetical protein C1645_736626 [Glomus cerebriforme]|uniref:Uncharacterized protein n=1 Tax=Glomus cerebriforme TaxID=658196 RepID=A0A397T0U1_9GLOM|nr:hypothetical protein C1645_736626 [Glomus cerebriforme]
MYGLIKSFSFQSNTRKWELFFELFSLEWEGKMVFRALQSRREGKTVLLAFGLVYEIGKCSFSFFVDSPLVWTLGIRKRFLDFVSDFTPKLEKLKHLALEIWNWKKISENSVLEKRHSALKMETEIFSFEVLNKIDFLGYNITEFQSSLESGILQILDLNFGFKKK